MGQTYQHLLDYLCDEVWQYEYRNDVERQRAYNEATAYVLKAMLEKLRDYFEPHAHVSSVTKKSGA